MVQNNTWQLINMSFLCCWVRNWTCDLRGYGCKGIKADVSQSPVGMRAAFYFSFEGEDLNAYLTYTIICSTQPTYKWAFQCSQRSVIPTSRPGGEEGLFDQGRTRTWERQSFFRLLYSITTIKYQKQAAKRGNWATNAKDRNNSLLHCGTPSWPTLDGRLRTHPR